MAHRSRASTMTVLQVLVGCILVVNYVEGVDWSYSGNLTGPAAWGSKYPSCKGVRQSPINLKSAVTTRLSELEMRGYYLKPDTMTLANNGHSIVVSATYPVNGSKPQIKISNDKIYELDNVHFHWGKNDSDGSEHAINDQKYTLEMHAVHKRVVNGSVPGDILVLGVLFEMSHYNNRGLQRFINNAKLLTSPNTELKIDPFRWSNLIPNTGSNYYMYNGSLTTPPCSEVVTWVVRKAVEMVSCSQMDSFRLLKNEEGSLIAGNFRPLQPLNGRQIFDVKR